MTKATKRCESYTIGGNGCHRKGTYTIRHEGHEYAACAIHALPGVFKPFIDKGPKRKPRIIGYLCVSTVDQDTDKNKAEILHFANERKLGSVEWIEEKVSGVKDWRKRRLGEIINELRANDVIITPELSRLGRSTLQVLEVIKTAKERGINVHAIKGGWSLNGTIESKALLTVFAMIAEIERDLISARTKEGMRARAAAGVTLGRPKGPGKSRLDPYKPEIVALLKNGARKTYVAERYGVTPVTLYHWLKKRKINAEPVIPAKGGADEKLSKRAVV